MKLYLVLPLAVAAACLAIVWFVNRRGACHAALWPKGMTLSGPIERPDVSFDGEITLACAARFGAVRCRTLRVLRGADVHATSVHAETVLVDGRLRGVRVLSASRLRVYGELYADDVRSKRIRLHSGARAVVLTVPRDVQLERHPNAEVKGFFVDLDEAKAVDSMRRLHGSEETSSSALLPT